jgi:hypothetical protein
MRVKDISVSKGMTVNIGGHQFAKTEFAMTITLDEGDDVDDETEKLTTLVNLKLAQEVEKVLPKRQTLMEDKKKPKGPLNYTVEKGA